MAPRDETQDRWVDLEQEGWGRASRHGRKPEKKFRDRYNVIPNNDREQLRPLLQEFFDFRPNFDELQATVPAVPTDMTTMTETDAYQPVALRRISALIRERDCLENILRLAEQHFFYDETAQILREEKDRREKARVKMDAEYTAVTQKAIRRRSELEALAAKEKESAPEKSQEEGHKAPATLDEGRALVNGDDSMDSDQLWADFEKDQAEGNARLQAERTEREKAEKERAEKARRDRGDLGRGWWRTGDEAIEGGHGEAGIWLKSNEFGVIVDRLVIKNAEAPSKKDCPYLWNNDKTVPNEVTAMYRLRPLQGSNNMIVKLRNWRISKKEQMYRLFLEWCPHGSLWDVLRDAQHMYWTDPPRARIPEPFCWFLFETLVNAGLLLQQGDLDPLGGMPGWEMIVHRDIKLPNVFLSVDSQSIYKGYKTPKLGDYGLSLLVPRDENRRSSQFRHYINKFSAPEERQETLENANDNPQRITRKTNVWSIGITMYSILMLEDGDPTMEAETYARYRKRRMPVEFPTAVINSYSPELRNLIWDCCQYLPSDRPSLDRLLKRIRRLTGYGSKDLADGLRHATADSPKFLKHALLLKREKYQLGTIEDPETMPLPPSPRTRKPDDDSDDDEDLGGPTGAEAIFDPKKREQAAAEREAKKKAELERQAREALATADAPREMRSKKRNDKQPAATDLETSSQENTREKKRTRQAEDAREELEVARPGKKKKA